MEKIASKLDKKVNTVKVLSNSSIVQEEVRVFHLMLIFFKGRVYVIITRVTTERRVK